MRPWQSIRRLIWIRCYRPGEPMLDQGRTCRWSTGGTSGGGRVSYLLFQLGSNLLLGIGSAKACRSTRSRPIRGAVFPSSFRLFTLGGGLACHRDPHSPNIAPFHRAHRISLRTGAWMHRELRGGNGN
jgi:hypothetical protein